MTINRERQHGPVWGLHRVIAAPVASLRHKTLRSSSELQNQKLGMEESRDRYVRELGDPDLPQWYGHEFNILKPKFLCAEHFL